MFAEMYLKSHGRLKKHFHVFCNLNTHYKNASTCVTVTLDKKHLSCCKLFLFIPKKTLDSHFLTKKACQLIGFLLFNGFIVQCFKVDI